MGSAPVHAHARHWPARTPSTTAPTHLGRASKLSGERRRLGVFRHAPDLPNGIQDDPASAADLVGHTQCPHRAGFGEATYATMSTCLPPVASSTGPANSNGSLIISRP